MVKQFIIISREGKPTQMCEIKTIKTSDEVLALKNQCEQNADEFEKQDKAKATELENTLKDLIKRVALMETELKYNRGEITETEYNELCNGIK